MILNSTRAFAFLVSGLAASQGAAQEIGPAIANYEAGVICPSTGNDVVGLPFVARTLVVPAVPGVAFGVRARTTAVVGPVEAQVVLVHPPFTPGGPTQQIFAAGFGSEEPGGFLYRFDLPEELALGRWRMQATAGTALLFDIEFDVIAPTVNEGLLRACGQ